MRKKKKREREREKAKITHINDDDRVDVKQGCGLFFSYGPVSVLHASSMSVNIYTENRRRRAEKASANQ